MKRALPLVGVVLLLVASFVVEENRARAEPPFTPFSGPLGQQTGAGGGGGGGSGTVGPGVAGEVAFFTAANQVQSDPGFTYNSVSDLVTIFGSERIAPAVQTAHLAPFEVDDGDGGSLFTGVIVAQHNATPFPYFAGFSSRGTHTAPTATQNGDMLIEWTAAGKTDVGLSYGFSPTIQMKATEAWTSTAFGSQIQFKIVPNTTTTQTDVFALNQGSAVFNDTGANYDLRVEGDTEPNLLMVDASADNVGIGTATPTSRLQVVKTINSGVTIEVLNTSAGAAAESQVALVEDGATGKYVSLEYLNSGFPTTGLQTASQGKYVSQAGAVGGWLFSTLNVGAPIVFAQGNITAASERLRMNATESVFNDNQQNVDFRVEGDTEPNLLMVDASADKVGIGTATPSARLHVTRAGNSASDFWLENTTVGTAAQTQIVLGHVVGTGNYGTIEYRNTGFTTSGLIVANQMANLCGPNCSGGYIAGTTMPAAPVIIVAGGSATTNERMRINNVEAVLNDASQNIDFRVEGVTEPNLLMVDASADKVGIGTATPTSRFTNEQSINGVGARTTIKNSNAGAAAQSLFELLNNNDGGLQIQAASTAFTPTNDYLGPRDVSMTLSTGTTFGRLLISAGPSSNGAGIAGDQVIIGTRYGASPNFFFDEMLTLTKLTFTPGVSSGTSTAVFNEDSMDMDFRVETDTKTNGLFIDASAETTDLNGGSANGGCSISAAGALTCAGAVAGSGTITGSGANTQVTFWTSATAISGDAGMTYNSATDSLTLTGDIAVNGGDITSSAVTLNITANSVQNLALTSGSVTFSDTAGASDSVINSLAGVTGFSAWSSVDANGSSIFLTTNAGFTSVGQRQNQSANAKVACFSDSMDPAAGSVTTLGCMAGAGFWITTAHQTATCAAGVLALDPQSAIIEIDPNGAACVVTIAETTAAVLGEGMDATIEIVTTAGAGVVTFPDVANIHNGPVLCTTTGINKDSVYTITYAKLANSLWLGKACTVN